MIVIHGRIPSKKNSRKHIRVKGKPMSIPSDRYTVWHNSAMLQVNTQRDKSRPGTTGMQLDFYFPDNRKADLTNKAESIMDLLVDARIIKDDSWQEVGFIVLKSCGIDRKEPRCEIGFL